MALPLILFSKANSQPAALHTSLGPNILTLEEVVERYRGQVRDGNPA